MSLRATPARLKLPKGLVIDKPLEIIGQGDTGEIVVQTTGKNVMKR